MFCMVSWMVSCGPVTQDEAGSPAGPGEPGLASEQRSAIEALRSIGYVEGTKSAKQAGVTIHETDRVQIGLNFFSSGHAPEAELMEMDGTVVHRWHRGFFDIWPESTESSDDPDTRWWRRCRLLPNGEVLAIFEGLGIVKLDRHSNVVWASANGAHHDLDLLSDGGIYVLTREAHIVPWYDTERPILEDFVALLDSRGEEQSRFSLLEAFEHSEFRSVWRDSGSRPGRQGDVFHTNSLEVLDGRVAARDPAFAEGNLLVSMLKLDAIAIVDPRRRTVVWARTGIFRRQHDPTILSNGNLLLFDNVGLGERSRVLELDPLSLATVWDYEGSDASPFYSEQLGASQRLSNGNTLITESDGGRAFEVTPGGEIVWEFHNPHRTGDDGELVARLSEVRRLPADLSIDWIELPEDE